MSLCREMQNRLINTVIEREKAALAAFMSPEFAELVYSPQTDYLLAIGYREQR